MRRIASLIAVISYILMPATLHAETMGACADKPLNEFEKATISERPSPIKIPPSLKNIASHDGVKLTVKTLDGQDICVRTAWMHVLKDMTLSADERFLQFHYYALEADGHILIDRTGNGQIIETGARPLFNKDRNYFMAMQHSGAGWGNLEGIAAWRVGNKGSERIFYSDEMANGPEYGVYWFDDSGCALIKAKSPIDRSSARPRSYIFKFGDTTSLAEGKDIESCLPRSSAYYTMGFPDPAAPEWHLVEELIEDRAPDYRSDMFFADRKSITDLGKFKTIRISHLMLLAAHEKDLSSAITDFRTRLLIDCKAGAYKSLEVAEYDGFEQLIMQSRLDPDMLDWGEPVTGSPYDKITEFACRKKHERPGQSLPPQMQPIKALLAFMHADWSK